MNFVEKAVIMNASDMNRAIKRMAHEVVEANHGVEKLVTRARVEKYLLPVEGELDRTARFYGQQAGGQLGR